MVEALHVSYRCIFDKLPCDRFVDDLGCGLCYVKELNGALKSICPRFVGLKGALKCLKCVCLFVLVSKVRVLSVLLWIVWVCLSLFFVSVFTMERSVLIRVLFFVVNILILLTLLILMILVKCGSGSVLLFLRVLVC